MVGLGSMAGYGIQSMLKEGHRHLSGLEEAVLKNIDACRELSAITRTSLGPNGESCSACAFASLARVVALWARVVDTGSREGSGARGACSVLGGVA
jgi:hypothetical protein